jgi:hypothetical protein
MLSDELLYPGPGEQAGKNDQEDGADTDQHTVPPVGEQTPPPPNGIRDLTFGIRFVHC